MAGNAAVESAHLLRPFPVHHPRIGLAQAGIGFGKGLLQTGGLDLRLAGDDLGQVATRSPDVRSSRLARLSSPTVSPLTRSAPQLLAARPGAGHLPDGLRRRSNRPFTGRVLADAPGAAAGLAGQCKRCSQSPSRRWWGNREQINPGFHLYGVGDDHIHTGLDLLFHPLLPFVGAARRMAAFQPAASSISFPFRLDVQGIRLLAEQDDPATLGLLLQTTR